MATPTKRPIRNSHCTSCGHPFPDPRAAYPRPCGGCNSTSYSNPLPVVLTLVPSDNNGKRGMTLIKRGIEPRKGLWAFPGGFLETGETWKEGGKRECHEEAGIEIDGDKLTVHTLTSINDSPTLGHLLIFTLHPPIPNLPPFEANHEASERKVFTERVKKEEMAFPAHWEVLEKWFDERDRAAGAGAERM